MTVWNFVAEPPTAVEYHSRLPWALGGKLLGEINLEAVFRANPRPEGRARLGARP